MVPSSPQCSPLLNEYNRVVLSCEKLSDCVCVRIALKVFGTLSSSSQALIKYTHTHTLLYIHIHAGGGYIHVSIE